MQGMNQCHLNDIGKRTEVPCVEIMKAIARKCTTALCAGALALLHVFSASAGAYYLPEVDAAHVLQAQTWLMTSNERLEWYLEQTGQAPDEHIVRAQQEVGEDCVAILNAGGEIREYVTQTTDNDFYLDHNAWGGEDVNGAAFFDARCKFFPQDDQVIIHGHNMKGGAVFGRLNNYREADYLRNHPLITLETLAGVDYYVPYAITDVNVDMGAENYFLEIVWDFEPQAFAHYTGYLKEKSYYAIPVDVQYGDKLLTLSTCSYVYSDSRLVICARKLRAGETPEEMSSLVGQSTVSGVTPDNIAPYTGGGDYENLTGRDINALKYETETDISYLQEAPPDLFVE